MIFELNTASTTSTVEQLCQQNGWIEPFQNITELTTPGEGNMNVVVRVKLTDGESLVLKQPRHFVRKYPQIPAPFERTAIENQFYDLIERHQNLRKMMPNRIGFDVQNSIMAIEDLGESSDFLSLYKSPQLLDKEDLTSAITFISTLHNTDFNETIRQNFPLNLALRKLNHEHLFVYPFMADNGFNLDTIQEGLQAAAMHFKLDVELKTELEKLGKIYLSAGQQLLHGDFYPGSWLKTKNGLKVIDPEFCFFGTAEYDLGVMIAHLKMANQPAESIDFVLVNYSKPTGFSEKLLWQFVGMELFRRIIGLAQVPLTLSLDEKISLLNEAREMVLKS